MSKDKESYNCLDKQETRVGPSVMVLSDRPASEDQDVIQATAALIDCAQNARLVAVICEHNESKKPATILCGIHSDPEHPEFAEYVPIAILFTGEDTPWEAYTPPKSATVVQDPEVPLIEFSKEVTDVAEPEVEEAT